MATQEGMLRSMRDPEYARGLITYLYAVVTIGTAVVLVVSALLGDEKVKQDDGRQVLGLLLGVFGTIVGFYFGNAASGKQTQATDSGLTLSPLRLTNATPRARDRVAALAFVTGGVPPYKFATGVGASPTLDYSQQVADDGWITAEFDVPDVAKEQPVLMTLGVKDSAGTVRTAEKSVTARPA